MSDYDDYENNLAFDPNANSGIHRSYTDRTQSTIELIEKIEQLTKEHTKLKDLLKDCYYANQAFIKTFEWLETIVTPTQRNICRKTAAGIKKLQLEIEELEK